MLHLYVSLRKCQSVDNFALFLAVDNLILRYALIGV